MNAIRCACGKEDCKIGFSFDEASHIAFFHDADDKETSMYLDANTAIALIKRLQSMVLYQMTEIASS